MAIPPFVAWRIGLDARGYPFCWLIVHGWVIVDVLNMIWLDEESTNQLPYVYVLSSTSDHSCVLREWSPSTGIRGSQRLWTNTHGQAAAPFVTDVSIAEMAIPSLSVFFKLFQSRRHGIDRGQYTSLKNSDRVSPVLAYAENRRTRGKARTHVQERRGHIMAGKKQACVSLLRELKGIKNYVEHHI